MGQLIRAPAPRLAWQVLRQRPGSHDLLTLAQTSLLVSFYNEVGWPHARNDVTTPL
jgi:hypothetical protein